MSDYQKEAQSYAESVVHKVKEIKEGFKSEAKTAKKEIKRLKKQGIKKTVKEVAGNIKRDAKLLKEETKREWKSRGRNKEEKK